jgi:hypothetical protein
LEVTTPPGPGVPAVPDCNDDDDAVSVGCVCRTIQNNGRSYALCSEQHPWEVWATGCLERGGLAVFEGSGDQNACRNALGPAASPGAWTNGTDEAVEGTFVARDGSALPFVGFAAGEPNNTPVDPTGEENCLELRDTPPGISDTDCSLQKQAFCGPLPVP